MASLAYNNAPFAVAYAVDDWFDTTTSQAAWLKPRVASLLAWHRHQELPAYRQWLDRARDRVGPAVTGEELSLLYAEATHALNRIGERALPDAAEFLLTLEPRQIDYLQRKFAKDNAKVAEALAQPVEKRRAKRVERYVERYEGWLGRLTDEQIGLIQARVAPLPFLDEGRLADRERWQRELVALLRTKPERERLQQELRVLLLSPERRRDFRYQAQWQEQQREILQLTAELVRTASDRQLERLRKRLGGYAEDVSALLRV